MANRPVHDGIETQRLLHLADEARDRAIEVQKHRSRLPELIRRSEELVTRAKKVVERSIPVKREENDQGSND